MTKVLEIERCWDCKYCIHIDDNQIYCVKGRENIPTVWRDTEKNLENSFPSFCPLPDKEEV